MENTHVYGKSWRRWGSLPIYFAPLQEAFARMESTLHLFYFHPPTRDLYGWKVLPIHHVLESQKYLHDLP
jgi:hypothetical protein